MPLAELSYLISIEIGYFAYIAIIGNHDVESYVPALNIHLSVVVIYEYLITIDREVHFAWNGWSRRFSWARCVFFLNRYLTILLYVTTWVQMSSIPNTALSCNIPVRMIQACEVTLYVVWAAFAGIRVYAISGCDRFKTTLVVVLALVPAVTTMYVDTLESVALTFQVCNESLSMSSFTWTILSVVTRSCLIISDAIVLVVTWLATWNTFRVARKLNIKVSFVSFILKAGTIHVSIVSSCNILQVVCDFVNIGEFSAILYFVNLFTPLLISRFFFDLHDLTTHDPQLSQIISTGRVLKETESAV
ncbi:hypothetical protein BD311DRAFT_758207 [Dichomitus squalens]|uniref:DUF6533 domain-containing protein n=1 Tax=Dichomitus squalens TaxID=114155 RepID=A0A4Q9MQD2_9APHY|nr:hypothetical protein BD311DRAFT_758207 [Dichomitus squalens]